MYDQSSNASFDGLAPTIFADPEWRGGVEEGEQIQSLRPSVQIHRQIERLASRIAAGSNYGWLGVYQARRAAFELRSIQAQMAHQRSLNAGDLPDDDRRAVQSRLDRLERCLETARAA